jgi:hypothetical protein
MGRKIDLDDNEIEFYNTKVPEIKLEVNEEPVEEVKEEPVEEVNEEPVEEVNEEPVEDKRIEVVTEFQLINLKLDQILSLLIKE